MKWGKSVTDKFKLVGCLQSKFEGEDEDDSEEICIITTAKFLSATCQGQTNILERRSTSSDTVKHLWAPIWPMILVLFAGIMQCIDFFQVVPLSVAISHSAVMSLPQKVLNGWMLPFHPAPLTAKSCCFLCNWWESCKEWLAFLVNNTWYMWIKSVCCHGNVFLFLSWKTCSPHWSSAANVTHCITASICSCLATLTLHRVISSLVTSWQFDRAIGRGDIQCDCTLCG